MSHPDPSYDPADEKKTDEEKEAADDGVLDPACEWCGGEGFHLCGECGDEYETKDENRLGDSHYCSSCYESFVFSLKH